MTGSPHFNSFSGQEANKIIRWSHLGEEKGEEAGGLTLYTNPLISTNCPDPSVLRLQDGSGYVLVATSDHASKSNNSSVFPLYLSEGDQSSRFIIKVPLNLQTSSTGSWSVTSSVRPASPGGPWTGSTPRRFTWWGAGTSLTSLPGTARENLPVGRPELTQTTLLDLTLYSIMTSLLAVVKHRKYCRISASLS